MQYLKEIYTCISTHRNTCILHTLVSYTYNVLCMHLKVLTIWFRRVHNLANCLRITTIQICFQYTDIFTYRSRPCPKAARKCSEGHHYQTSTSRTRSATNAAPQSPRYTEHAPFVSIMWVSRGLTCNHAPAALRVESGLFCWCSAGKRRMLREYWFPCESSVCP